MNMEKQIYWIGGSPCCGKSTMAERLVAEYGFQYYKCDDYIEDYVRRGCLEDIQIMKKLADMTLDETWLRSVEELVNDEFAYYKAAIKYALYDIYNMPGKGPFIVEGAILLPEKMIEMGIEKDKYICMVPEAAFQLDKYKERPWVSHYLRTCSQPETAFENWMKRDIEFAEIVKKDAQSFGMKVITVDGTRSINSIYASLLEHFNIRD